MKKFIKPGRFSPLITAILFACLALALLLLVFLVVR
jgi:hypothetical protein